MACALESCDNGFEIRIHPETGIPYAFGCKQCKPNLRYLQINAKFDYDLGFQDALQRRINKIKEGDRNAS